MKNLQYIFLLAFCFATSLNTLGQGGPFVENKGQFHDNVRYKAKLPYGKLFIEYNRFTYLFHDASDYDLLYEHPRKNHQDTYTLNSHAFRINLKKKLNGFKNLTQNG